MSRDTLRFSFLVLLIIVVAYALPWSAHAIVSATTNATAAKLESDISFQRRNLDQWLKNFPNQFEVKRGLLDSFRLYVLLGTKDRQRYSDIYQEAIAFYELSDESLRVAEKSFQRSDYSNAAAHYRDSLNLLLTANLLHDAAHQIWSGELAAAEGTLFSICQSNAWVGGKAFGGIAGVISGGTAGAVVDTGIGAGMKVICNNAFNRSENNVKDIVTSVAMGAIGATIRQFSDSLAWTVDVLHEFIPVNKVTAPDLSFERKEPADIIKDFVKREESMSSSQSQAAVAHNAVQAPTSPVVVPPPLPPRVAASSSARPTSPASSDTTQIIPKPFSTLTTDFGGINYGQSTTIRWSSSNATSCAASGGWSGNKALSGSEDTGPLYSTQTFILTCTGPGGSVTQSTYVNVSDAPLTSATSPSDAPSPSLILTTKSPPGAWVKSGQSASLIWSSSNVTTCTASGGWSGSKAPSGSGDTPSIFSTQTFILTCTGPGGSVTRDTSVGVADAPEITTVDTYAGTQGKTFNISGSKFTHNGGVTLHFSKSDGSFYPDQHTNANYYGGFSFSWPIPADAMPGSSSVSATDDTSGMQTASIGFKVIAASQTSGDLTLSVSPTSGPTDTVFTVSGTNFTPNSAVIIRFEKPDTDQYANQYKAAQPAADSNGNVSYDWHFSDWHLPDNILLGTISVYALDNVTGRRSQRVSIEITAP